MSPEEQQLDILEEPQDEIAAEELEELTEIEENSIEEDENGEEETEVEEPNEVTELVEDE